MESLPLFKQSCAVPVARICARVSCADPLRHPMLTGNKRCAPFVYDAWKHPKTLEIVSRIAGIDLVPVMDWEIGHINISVKSEEQKNSEVEKAGRGEDDDRPIVDWHTDSYPFVCVLMLSDCREMIGGETALRKGDRSIVKVRGPQMV